MPQPFFVYINNVQFGYLADNERYSDRQEFYKEHEKTLWTIYQLLKLDKHSVTITNIAKITLFNFTNAADFRNWVKENYPAFEKQLDNLSYTAFPIHEDLI
ncbi:MAG: hypothetical protein KBG47_02695 [Bacteroidia bacterium]|nr:hypothetical protein [Bacteroidia bacterium]